MEFYNREPKGTVIKFEAGEILQKGCFYRDNLRQARAAFVYVSDGQEGWVRPHFTYKLSLDVPFGQTVEVRLPRAAKNGVLVNGELRSNGNFTISAGHYELTYQPDEDYIERYSLESPIGEIMQDEAVVSKLAQVAEVINFFRDPGNRENFGKMSLPQVANVLPFINIDAATMKQISAILTATPILSERTK